MPDEAEQTGTLTYLPNRVRPTRKVVRGPYIYRFACEACGSERDQGLYRQNANQIKCVCGGKAFKTSPDEVVVDGVPTMVLDWWTKGGKPYMQEQSIAWAIAHRKVTRGLPRRSLMSIIRSWLHLE